MEQIKLDCTFVIKTFNRPPVLFNLLQSIRLFYKTIDIIVVDDSNDDKKIINKNYCEKFKAKRIDLPFDTGLSEGRNIGVSHVKTKFTHILDDDSLLKEESRLEKLQYILENTNIDLIGTSMDNTEKRLTYARNFESVKVKKDNDYDKYTLTWNQDLKDKVNIEDYTVYKCNIVNNNFMAYTDKLMQCPWRSYLKLQEHELFFIDWYFKNFTVGVCPDLTIHATIFIKKEYREFRKRKFLRNNELTIVSK